MVSKNDVAWFMFFLFGSVAVISVFAFIGEAAGWILNKIFPKKEGVI